jgi:WD40 repeat protein
MNRIKYFDIGKLHLTYNLVTEEYNYCSNIEDKAAQNVTAYAISPNLKFMAFGVLPGLTKLLETATQKIIYTLSGNLGIRVSVLKFSKDSSMLIQGTNENRVKAWEVERSRMAYTLQLKSEGEIDDL